MSHSLKGQVALITGAGRGFGAAIAERFAAEGAKVGLTARSRDQLEEVLRRIEQAGGRAFAVTGDVSQPEDVAHIVRAIENDLGEIDVLVNNAGIGGAYGPVWAADPETWWRLQEVHVRGAFLFMNRVVPKMIARRAGRVITVASLAGTTVMPNLSSYGIAKATQINLTKFLAVEGGPHGVVAFAIEPGTVVTALAESTMVAEDAHRWVPGFVAYLNDLKQAEDPRVGLDRCASFCLELASGKWDALSGQYLAVDDDLSALVRQKERDAQAAGPA